MKIAIVAPSPAPFEVGGAENLWWGLQQSIRADTPHVCELIKLPTKEKTFWDLVDSYRAFYTLDVSSFDLVVSGKYPGWMVRHPNHHVYMLHCLRGLYDMYDYILDTPENLCAFHPRVSLLLRALEQPGLEPDRIFDLLHELRSDGGVPERAFAFPGPLIKRIVRALDRCAMERVVTFSAISHTVARRRSYYPAGAAVTVVHPPSALTGFANKSYDFFFTASRLDSAKRINEIVEAYSAARTDIPLKIAGTGPLQETLAASARRDPRIELLGFIDNAALLDHYARARAVIYVPFDEDYGYITVEAMASGKPVITYDDSGGVMEFVENGRTGFVCPPKPAELTRAIERCAALPLEQLRQMGQSCHRRVAQVTWHHTTSDLLRIASRSQSARRGRRRRPKLTILSTYPIFPPRGGGQNRIFYLYSELAKSMTVESVCLSFDTNGSRREIAPNFLEIVAPKSRPFIEREVELQRRVGIPVTDLVVASDGDKLGEYIDAARRSSSDADCIICEHPYTYRLVEKHLRRGFVHASHNVESVLKRQMLPVGADSDALVAAISDLEQACCTDAELNVFCTLEDAATMRGLYRCALGNAIEVANGVDLESVQYTSWAERQAEKTRLGLRGSKLALFIGSHHKPNVDAVRLIIDYARQLPGVTFLVVGGVEASFKGSAQPPNLRFTGVVDDVEKEVLLGLADVALNPMMAGSGSNLKMLDYIAAGVPVISTAVGARGFRLPDGAVILRELDQFANAIIDPIDVSHIERARRAVERAYSWEAIASAYGAALCRHFEGDCSQALPIELEQRTGSVV